MAFHNKPKNQTMLENVIASILVFSENVILLARRIQKNERAFRMAFFLTALVATGTILLAAEAALGKGRLERLAHGIPIPKETWSALG